MGIAHCSNMRCSPKRALGTFMNWWMLYCLAAPVRPQREANAAVLLPLPSPVFG